MLCQAQRGGQAIEVVDQLLTHARRQDDRARLQVSAAHALWLTGRPHEMATRMNGQLARPSGDLVTRLRLQAAQALASSRIAVPTAAGRPGRGRPGSGPPARRSRRRSRRAACPGRNRAEPRAARRGLRAFPRASDVAGRRLPRARSFAAAAPGPVRRGTAPVGVGRPTNETEFGHVTHRRWPARRSGSTSISVDSRTRMPPLVR